MIGSSIYGRETTDELNGCLNQPWETIAPTGMGMEMGKSHNIPPVDEELQTNGYWDRNNQSTW